MGFDIKKGVVGAQVKAVCEMPRPCLEKHAQAQRILPSAKSILTSTNVIVGNTLLNVLEQLLQYCASKIRITGFSTEIVLQLLKYWKKAI